MVVGWVGILLFFCRWEWCVIIVKKVFLIIVGVMLLFRNMWMWCVVCGIFGKKMCLFVIKKLGSFLILINCIDCIIKVSIFKWRVC